MKRHLLLALSLFGLTYVQAQTVFQVLIRKLQQDSSWQVAQEIHPQREDDDVERAATVLFHTDSAGMRSGPAIVLYEDGYILYGDYVKDKREGSWWMYPIGRKGDRYHFRFRNGRLVARAGPKQIRRKEEPQPIRTPNPIW